MSAEHRGQLVLYGLMLNIQRNEDPLTTLQRGLLLYLKLVLCGVFLNNISPNTVCLGL